MFASIVATYVKYRLSFSILIDKSWQLFHFFYWFLFTSFHEQKVRVQFWLVFIYIRVGIPSFCVISPIMCVRLMKYFFFQRKLSYFKCTCTHSFVFSNQCLIHFLTSSMQESDIYFSCCDKSIFSPWHAIIKTAWTYFLVYMY